MSDTSRQEELKRQRDELRLQLHLASMEAREEWEGMMADWDNFASRTQLSKSAEEVGEAAKQLGLRLKDAYDRFRKGVE